MEFAFNRRQADNSYKPFVENSVVAYLWIVLGAVFGASARYFISGYIARAFSTTFPYGTLLINFTGSLVLGFFLVLAGERLFLDPRWRLLIAIGFCGSYTTFSSYAFETFAYIEQGQWLLAGLNVVASNVLCLGRGSSRSRPRPRVVEWQRLWLYKSPCISPKATPGTTGRCTWRC